MFRRGEPIALRRDVTATQVPYGTPVPLYAGMEVRITQALGNSYTVITDEGFMARISASDADALGLEVEGKKEWTPEEIAHLTTPDVEKMVWDQLRTVYDPEIPVNVVELGLVYSCVVTPVEGGHRVDVKMTLTAPGCGMGPVLAAEARSKILSVPTVHETDIEVVFDPPWDQSMMSEAARLQLGM